MNWDRAKSMRGALHLSESFLLKAVGLLLALILWVTILGFKREELKKAIKFEPVLPPGMVITNKVPISILFTFSGPRILLKDLDRKLVPIRPDLRRTRDNTIGLSISEDLLGELPSGIRIVSYYPPNVLIRLEELSEKRIRVKPLLQGDLAPGYELASVTTVPAGVSVLAARSIVETTPFLSTVPIDISNLAGSKELDVEVSIDDEEGLQLTEVRLVHVKIRVKPVK